MMTDCIKEMMDDLAKLEAELTTRKRVLRLIQEVISDLTNLGVGVDFGANADGLQINITGPHVIAQAAKPLAADLSQIVRDPIGTVDEPPATAPDDADSAPDPIEEELNATTPDVKSEPETIDLRKTDPDEPPQHVTGPWSDEEKAKAIAMLEDGHDGPAVARALNRKPGPCSVVCKKLAADMKNGSPTGQYKVGPWSVLEIEAAKHILRADGSERDVAVKVGRELNAVSVACKKFRREIAREDAERMTKAEPVTKSPPVPVSKDVPFEERQVEAHLNSLGYVEPWDPDLDLEMAVLIASGTKAAHVADIFELTKTQVIDRWKHLCPVVTIENQKRLLSALRRRAGQKVAAE